MTLKFNSEAELFTARRDILRRCMPHGNLWGWGDEQRRDSISAANADPPPEPTKARLLVLVNPAAGKGRGVAAYERDVAPVLAALNGCGVVVEMRAPQPAARAAAPSQPRGSHAPASVDGAAPLIGHLVSAEGVLLSAIAAPSAAARAADAAPELRRSKREAPTVVEPVDADAPGARAGASWRERHKRARWRLVCRPRCARF